MTPALIIDRHDGSVRIDGCPLLLVEGLAKARVSAELSRFYHSNIDHQNGYEWLMFHGVSFGGQPCSFSLCFHLGQQTEVHLGVALPNAKLDGGWPTRATIDEEIAFVRNELKNQLARQFQSGQERFSWGVVWSQFDPKGFKASAGLRYES